MSDHGHAHHKEGSAGMLARAERVCASRGLRLTPVRRRVLEALAASPQPLGAYDLSHSLSQERRLSAVSVYRSLEFLEEIGLIHRLSTRPAYVACSHDHGRDEATVFLVCRTCGSVDEVASARLDADLAAVSAQAGFTPERRALELEGRCAACIEVSSAA
jgi:Fur family zinc uptake transcriptional regulator